LKHQRRVSYSFTCKVEDEKVFEDKLELVKNGTFSFVQKEQNKNRTLLHNKTLNNIITFHNLTLNESKNVTDLLLLHEISLYVKGKSNLTQSQIEHKLIEKGLNNTDDFISKFKKYFKKDTKKVAATNKTVPSKIDNNNTFKKNRFIQKAVIKIDEYKFSDEKYQNIMNFFQKYKKIPSFLPASENKNIVNPKRKHNLKIIPKVVITPEQDGPVSYSNFKQKTKELLSSSTNIKTEQITDGPILIDLENDDKSS